MDDESINDSYSTKMACPKCGFSIQELEPRLFSFNSPSGACSSCDGLGYKSKIDLSKLILRPELSLNQGAIKDWDASHTYHNQYLLNRVSNTIGFSLDTPFENLTDKEQEIILYGSTEEINFSYVSKRGFKREIYKPFEGIVNNIERRLSDTDSNFRRDYYAKFMTNTFCDECEGTRLNLEARSVFINNFSLPEIVSMTIDDSLEFFSNLSIPGVKGEIAIKIIKEIKERLNFLSDVGLNYLTLSRSAETLSGGEAQRIRLASQIGAGLVGVTYILDEPSIGLHQRDNKKLLSTLKRLKELGNTVIVVEHDQETIEEADHIIDIGPKAGVHGGEVCFSGNINDLKKATNSLTSKYVFGKKKIQINKKNKIEDKGMIKISGCSGNNLKKVNLEIPLGNIIAITGVSGSGKSTLINQTLYPALSNKLNKSSLKTEPFEVIEGIDLIDKVIEISQSPIGRTPRSNPVTYTGIFTPIRELFAGTQEARSKGYKPGRFSFNVKGGRCEACEGDGMIKVEMHFLPDVYVKCDVCDGQRYNSETLTIRYKGKNISEVLGLTVEQATVFFQAVPKIKKKLDTLNEVGLGYLRLGQPATTLSGGEAQRVKLAKELSKTSTGRTIYLLDEPTTGLHFHDVQLLMDVLHKLNSQGNTIVVIEHNLDVIKNSDWIIDIGPEGGNGGGEIVAAGILDKVSKVRKSYTGKFLK
tara:strand:- start:4095 stop:6191 length:2097 start_codon:yes stop_codon:yes gene_type:complete